MNKKLKPKWLKALRSGKYKQGTAYLRSTNDRYCCLGVLLDVAGVEWRGGGGDICYASGFGRGSRTGLSAYRMRQFGLSSNEVNALMSMNDIDRKSFEQIAQYISETL